MDAPRWKQLKTAFDEAIALEGDARSVYLSALESGDPELLAELLQLLEADEAPASIVEEGAGPLIEGVEALPDPRIGTRIGPWKLVERIGEGGMGVVYLAERTDGFEQRVALKVVRRGMDSEAILRRFGSERQILARLEHPNIARLLDGGLTNDGLPYFTMELVEGTPLTDYADQRRLSVDERLELFETVCEAVHYAQQRLVVHRDLKPANILVTPSGTVKLLDFGIARVLADDGSPLEATQIGVTPLTPAYAAPEQTWGGDITTATDVYALGVTLYELLTGERPGYGRSDTDRPASPLTNDPVRPSVAITKTQETVSVARSSRPEQLRRRLAGDLDNICLKALRPEPERRYATAGELLDDLRRHGEGLPVRARPDTLAYRMSRFAMRHRAALVGTGAAAAAIALTIGIYTARLADERDRAQTEALKAEEVSAFLAGLFEVSDPSESRGRQVTARELLESGARRIETELAGQPEIQAEMLATIGRVYTSLGLFEEARLPTERALELRREVLGPSHEDVAASLSELANLSRETGRLQTADSLQRTALAMDHRLLDPPHPSIAADLWRLGRIGAELRDPGADSLLLQSLAMRRELFPEDHVDVAMSLQALGWLRYTEGRMAEAVDWFQQARDILERLYDPGHPLVIAVVDDWADALAVDSRPDQAEAVLRDVVAQRNELLGPNHIDVIRSMHNLGMTIQFQRRNEEAIAIFEEALARLESTVGQYHPTYSGILGNLAVTNYQAGNLDEAEAVIRLNMVIDDSIYGPDTEPFSWSYSILGNILAGKGQYEEALEWYERQYELNEKIEAHDPEVLAGAHEMNLRNRAMTYADMGDHDREIELYHRAADAITAGYPDDAGEQVNAYVHLTRALIRHELWDEAFVEARRVIEFRWEVHPEGSWWVGSSYAVEAEVLYALERYREAEEALLTAWDLLYGADDDYYAATVLRRTRITAQQLVTVYEALGDPAEAARWAERVEELTDEG
jgi:serine/threonine-protein kinase